jgi:hypothetical protein
MSRKAAAVPHPVRPACQGSDNGLSLVHTLTSTDGILCVTTAVILSCEALSLLLLVLADTLHCLKPGLMLPRSVRASKTVASVYRLPPHALTADFRDRYARRGRPLQATVSSRLPTCYISRLDRADGAQVKPTSTRDESGLPAIKIDRMQVARNYSGHPENKLNEIKIRLVCPR